MDLNDCREEVENIQQSKVEDMGEAEDTQMEWKDNDKAEGNNEEPSTNNKRTN